MVQNRVIMVKHLGLIDYKEALAIQEVYYKTMVDQKHPRATVDPSRQPVASSYLLFCEHPPVYTLGRGGSMNHLLVDAATLATQKITLYHVNRGGDITYHGPGQLVVYPIIDLDFFFRDIHRYLRLLEASVIEMLAHFNIPSTSLPGLTGVWLKADKNSKPFDRKICSIGIRVSRWITMHGLALNVNNELAPFDQIIPCGIPKAVTSMQQELNKSISIMDVSDILAQIILKKLNYV
ncbi:lipoate-protein ligase B [Cardinium endosymbiont cEper1 of Encarsia pergandiella]|uniref:lipoyl(octanoyl) transferase LipB n=1 Tax=Cardinium endosymbiont of Encarsia pergandiella TaxID=249402 RepID=UPI00027E9F2E|nr:lipoyl(octanoyl) transferase LipB [Cardinium endosymbiont of Encarsia pergandiella]CCM10095.1 lipoate-protein ligase B [Cardinium endosymbiont cEper1 of Encarsia pergandiella]